MICSKYTSVLSPFREDATTLDGSNYILTLVDGFLVPKENGSLEDERREEISGLDSFPTPVTIPPVTISPERFGSGRENSSENELETVPSTSVGDEGEVETESPPEANINIVDTEAKFPKTTESGISGINEGAALSPHYTKDHLRYFAASLPPSFQRRR